ncbi:hypothetical protein FAIPA1_440023 [Frankia sp. AiPs1]
MVPAVRVIVRDAVPPGDWFDQLNLSPNGCRQRDPRAELGSRKSPASGAKEDCKHETSSRLGPPGSIELPGGVAWMVAARRAQGLDVDYEDTNGGD